MTPEAEETIYVGLDVAGTTGVSLFFPRQNEAICFSIKATPIEQIQEVIRNSLRIKQQYNIQHEDNTDLLFCFEKVFHFRNAKTTRDLVERYGFMKYTLLHGRYRVVEVHLRSARSWLGVKSKQENLMHFVPHYMGSMLTSDHADATSCALYQAHLEGHTVDWSTFRLLDRWGKL